MWELDYKESWAPKNWCFWTVVLEKTLESPLDCKEIQPVHPKISLEYSLEGVMLKLTPILWPSEVKNWLTGKEPDAGKDWRREETGTGTTGWDGWMASLTWWTWVSVSSGSWWWTGRPGMLQSVGVTKSWTRLSNGTEGTRGLFLWLQRSLPSDHVCCPAWKFLWPGPAELHRAPLLSPPTPASASHPRGLGESNADACESALQTVPSSHSCSLQCFPQNLRKSDCAAGCTGHGLYAQWRHFPAFKALQLSRERNTLRQSQCWVLLGQEESSQSGANSSPSLTLWPQASYV